MEREDAIFPQYYRLQRGAWEYMEIPLPVPTERRRCLSHPLFRDANPRGCTSLFNRAGSRSTHATGRPWCMEHDTSMVRRYRDSIVHRHLLRSTLLQRHHYLVLLLSFQFTGGTVAMGEMSGG